MLPPAKLAVKVKCGTEHVLCIFSCLAQTLGKTNVKVYNAKGNACWRLKIKSLTKTYNQYFLIDVKYLCNLNIKSLFR